MIAVLDEDEMHARLHGDHWITKLLAEVVCSTYWGGAGVDLRELDRLDADNWALAVAIMGYRRTPRWSDNEFCALAVWCRDEHHLDQWRKEE